MLFSHFISVPLICLLHSPHTMPSPPASHTTIHRQHAFPLHPGKVRTVSLTVPANYCLTERRKSWHVLSLASLALFSFHPSSSSILHFRPKAAVFGGPSCHFAIAGYERGQLAPDIHLEEGTLRNIAFFHPLPLPHPSSSRGYRFLHASQDFHN